MMDMNVVKRIENLLEYPQDISQKDLNQRMSELEVCFRQLYPKLPDFNLHEKAIFVKLLTRSNDLMKRSMEHLMKALNLTPETLHKMEEGARKSDSPESKAFISVLENLNAQAEALKKSISHINTKFNPDAIKGNQGPSAAEQKRKKRSGWYKP